MRRTFLATCCAALLGLTASAGELQGSCCAKPRAAEGLASASRTKCSITGKFIEKCCCVQQEAKTYCTLANKAVEKCCCSRVEEEAQPKQPN